MYLIFITEFLEETNTRMIRYKIILVYYIGFNSLLVHKLMNVYFIHYNTPTYYSNYK